MGNYYRARMVKSKGNKRTQFQATYRRSPWKGGKGAKMTDRLTSKFTTVQTVTPEEMNEISIASAGPANCVIVAGFDANDTNRFHIQLTASGGNIAGNTMVYIAVSYAFQFNDCTGYTVFQSLFDFYRLNHVEWAWYPVVVQQGTVSESALGAANTFLTGDSGTMLYNVVDYNSSATFATSASGVAAAQEYANCRAIKMCSTYANRPISWRKITPRVLQNVEYNNSAGNVAAAVEGKSKEWLATSTTGCEVTHYGIRSILTIPIPMNGIANGNTYVLDFNTKLRYNLSFKETR